MPGFDAAAVRGDDAAANRQSQAGTRGSDLAAAMPTPKALEQIQGILDRHCLFGVNINPEMRVKVATGEAERVLDEQGWRVFLVKVANEAGTTAKLNASSPNAKKLHGSPAEEVANRWLDLAMFDVQPLSATLNGLALRRSESCIRSTW